MVRRIHQKREQHLERIVHFGMVDGEPEAGPDKRHRRQDAKPESGAVDTEIADRIDKGAVEPDFLLGLTQRRVAWRPVGGVDLAAWKGDLASMLVEMGRAL